MHFIMFWLGLLPSLAQGTNIILSNDDGRAEINIRVLYDTLTRAGDSVVLSAPAENESGTGIIPTPLPDCKLWVVGHLVSASRIL